MKTVLYRRHRFPPSVAQHSIGLKFRFAFRYRDVGDLIAERGIEVSYETVRRLVAMCPVCRVVRQRAMLSGDNMLQAQIPKPPAEPPPR